MAIHTHKKNFTKENISDAPKTPGIYIFWNSKRPIYVGKANILRNRLRSYTSINLYPKTQKMIGQTKYFSVIRVASELEALLLEAKLVQKYKPEYNIQLKDDKHPLYIKITKEKYPRVLTARRLDEKRIRDLAFFGPFPSSASVKKVLRLIRKTFPYSQHKIGKRGCLYSQIGLCNPCPNEIEKLPEGKQKEFLYRKYRQNIRQVVNVLNGKIKSVRNNLVKEMKRLSKDERFEEAKTIREQISSLDYITKPTIPVNEYLKDPNLIDDIRKKELRQLKEILAKFTTIKNLKRIECYDVSHLAGSSPTASMVTFINGEPEKTYYRHFKIRQEKGQDDLASLKEVIKRRLKHSKDWGLPDLFVVDGGKTQTKIFLNELKHLNIPVVGLAKRFETLIIPYSSKNKDKFYELTIKDGHALNLLQRLRDEAHRFARRLHHQRLRKELFITK